MPTGGVFLAKLQADVHGQGFLLSGGLLKNFSLAFGGEIWFNSGFSTTEGEKKT